MFLYLFLASFGDIIQVNIKMLITRLIKWLTPLF